MHLESSRFPNRVNNKIKICFSTNCQAHLTLSFSLSFFFLSRFLFSLFFFFFLRTRCKEINFLNASALFFVPFSVQSIIIVACIHVAIRVTRLKLSFVCPYCLFLSLVFIVQFFSCVCTDRNCNSSQYENHPHA